MAAITAEAPAPGKWPRAAVGLFFLLLLAIGLACFRDYGVAWDEETQRTIGGVTIRYLALRYAPSLLPADLQNQPPLHSYKDRDYGVAFEVPALLLEEAIGFDSPRRAIFFRHLLIFIVCLGGVVALYRTAARRFGDWRLGLLAAGLLVLTPRLFAESFYNSKDMVFLALFALATATAISFFERPSIGRALVCAAACGVAIDVRLMAVVVPLSVLAVLAARLLRRQLPLVSTLAPTATYLLATAVCVVAFWPWLWADPVGHFRQAFVSMAKFRWPYEVLYLGDRMAARDLPWHYPLVWIAISTPLPQLLLFGVGLYAIGRQAVARRWRLWQGSGELQDLYFCGLCLGPLAAVIGFDSVLYDGWRQLYFIYPAFLLIAVRGWQFLWQRLQRPASRALLAATVALALLSTALWMVRVHPLQNVYFNLLAGSQVGARFELDYWGLSNRMALERILERDPSPTINVWEICDTPLQRSLPILEPAQRARLRHADDQRYPLYFINNRRFFKNPDSKKRSEPLQFFDQVTVGSEVILTIHKVAPPPGAAKTQAAPLEKPEQRP